MASIELNLSMANAVPVSDVLAFMNSDTEQMELLLTTKEGSIAHFSGNGLDSMSQVKGLEVTRDEDGKG
jgi:hypothetical protein